MQREPFLIVGTGAMACLFGAHLAPHADLTLLGTWSEGLAALQAGGIRLVVDGQEASFPVRATADTGVCEGIRHALVLVKSWQTRRAAEQLAQCLAPDGIALTLQNGLGNLEVLQDALGSERAALGVTTYGATLLAPARVRAGGVGVTHGAHHPRLPPLIERLRQAGIRIELADDLLALLWGKLSVNAGINPLTALLRVPNGELLGREHSRALMVAATEEVAAVAEACGIRLAHADPAAHVIEVARRTAANRSSMLQDVLRGAPTEIDAICGAVVLEGQRLGVPTPVNWTFWNLIRSVVTPSAGDDHR
ncbi:MAG TPA: ketopantoate reductase family protein [Anaerolineales bacterium]|nr:ketopantoate reductase family protein [Anaerolineales bacterium]